MRVLFYSAPRDCPTIECSRIGGADNGNNRNNDCQPSQSDGITYACENDYLPLSMSRSFVVCCNIDYRMILI